MDAGLALVFFCVGVCVGVVLLAAILAWIDRRL